MKAVLGKAIGVLSYVGVGIGLIVDLCSCVHHIVSTYRRYKDGEITKEEFAKSTTQKIAEFITHLIFTALSVVALVFLGPGGAIVGGILALVDMLVSYIVKWIVGKLWDGLSYVYHKYICNNSITV